MDARTRFAPKMIQVVGSEDPPDRDPKPNGRFRPKSDVDQPAIDPPAG
jgi:hypothetical protein